LDKWTNEQIASKVESEGLGYMIEAYLSHDSIEDDDLAMMWKDAAELLSEIQNHLEPFMNNDDEE
jgi:hypothetical protein